MQTTSASMTAVVFAVMFRLVSLSVVVEGFTNAKLQKTKITRSNAAAWSWNDYNHRISSWGLTARSDDDDEDDDEDDDLVDPASLGDWRKFRASLIQSSSTSQAEDDDDASTVKQPTSQNEVLLAQQSADLAREYREGVWAHGVAQAEVGGLLCRLPLEAEIYRNNGDYWKEQLDRLLSLREPSNAADSKDAQDVEHWFATAERMVQKEIEAITSSGLVKNGVLNPNDLDEKHRSLMDKYIHYKQTWQEICLLTSHNPETAISEAVVLNRPITRSINRNLATLLLKGGRKNEDCGYPHDFVDQIVQAFGSQAAVYMGGPQAQDEQALLMHGIANLAGATEIAAGTGIYCGGWEAAVHGVLEGTYQPLDFRFFLGRQVYHPQQKSGALVTRIASGAYQPLACSRALALKQCLGLPKPLWHEVLELCGGELEAISNIELRKRVDLPK